MRKATTSALLERQAPVSGFIVGDRGTVVAQQGTQNIKNSFDGSIYHESGLENPFLHSDSPVAKRPRHKRVGDTSKRSWRIIAVMLTLLACAGLVVLVTEFSKSPTNHDQVATAWLVESLPVGDFDAISELPGVLSTWQTLTKMVNQTNQTLDVTVMYWDLLAWNSTDSKYFTPAQLEKFGADWGQQLFNSFEAAAQRGVEIRFLQSYSATQLPYELLYLQHEYPKQVSVFYWNADAWFDGGIMHQKLWIADKERIYIGSANMDWKSLAQVKELGIYSESVALAADLTNYFEQWVQWASLTAEGQTSSSPNLAYTTQAWSSKFDCNLTKPCWSKLLPSDSHDICPSPITRTPSFTWESQMSISINNESSEAFISGSPQEVLGTTSIGSSSGDSSSWRLNSGDGDGQYLREWDQDGIIRTIQDATSFIGLSVMDFVPTDLYDGGHTSDGQAQPVWWPAFIDPLIAAAYARGVNVKLLISKWAHTNSKIEQYLNFVNGTAAICSEKAKYTTSCRGTFEIRLFEVPGWNDTYGKNASWPSYSRVNHAKYVVTDRRVNIGTSNHAWGYFYNTAGASFNSNNSDLRQQLEDIFLRDWTSSYAVPL